MALGLYTTFTLDMVPGGAPPIIHVSAEDVGRKYTVNLTYNGEPYDIQGDRLTIAGTKPDNTVFEYPVDDFEQNESWVDFLIKEQMAIVPGTVRCKLREYLNDDQIGSATFILDVDEYVYDPEAASESYIPTYETAIQEALENVADDIADLATAAAINDVKQYSDAASASATAAAGSATSAQTSAGTATTAAGSATSAAEDAEDSADRAEAAAESMAAYNTDRTPYLLRQSGGGVEIAGDREYDTIVGGTVAFNQLCNGSSVTVQNGHKYLSKIGSTWTVGASTGTAISNLTSGSDMVIDLTQMFGSTIADYIYNLEQATAGAGVAWFRQYFPEDYYEYNAGELKSVSGVSAHVMRDADENIIGNYPLDDSLTLRGIPKLDGGKLYYDGDTYEADGTVTRKYGVVVLNGSQDIQNINWRNTETSVGWIYSASVAGVPFVNPSEYAPIVCDKLSVCTYADLYGGQKTDGVGVTNAQGSANRIVIRSSDMSLTTKAAINAHMAAHPVTVVFPLYEHTTETADPFTNPQVVDPDGTEEYVTDSIVPVGHDTRYRVNLRDKLEPIFNVPTADGTYTLTVTVSNGVATYSWVAQ